MGARSNAGSGLHRPAAGRPPVVVFASFAWGGAEGSRDRNPRLAAGSRTPPFYPVKDIPNATYYR